MFYHDILLPVIKVTKILLTLNSDIQGSFKKFSLLFRQAEMVFVIVWLFDHFALKPVSSVNGVWIITFANHLHVWVTNFKPLFMFFQMLVLTLNYLIWMNFFVVLFDEAQHLVKTSMAGYVSVCYEFINLFIQPQNFPLMFFICVFKMCFLSALPFSFREFMVT